MMGASIPNAVALERIAVALERIADALSSLSEAVRAEDKEVDEVYRRASAGTAEDTTT
jgi:hypothetical protein